MEDAKRSRSVSFNLTNVQVHPVDRIDDVPASEVEATWYSQLEYRVMKSEITLTLQVLRARYYKTPETTTGLCYRGLELQASSMRQNDIRRAARALVCEQKRQRCEGVNDPDMLATVYHGFTILCSDTAQRIGRLDEEQAANMAAGLEEQHKEKKEAPLRQSSLLRALYQQSESSIQQECSLPAKKPLEKTSRLKLSTRNSILRVRQLQRFFHIKPAR